MPDTATQSKPARPTLSDQLARQHELLMAAATKPARTGSQSAEFGERATGGDAGSLYLKSLVLVQNDGEEDVQFLGRQERTLRDVRAMLARIATNQPAPDAGADGAGS